MTVERALLNSTGLFSVLSDDRALLSVYRALLSDNRALLSNSARIVSSSPRGFWRVSFSFIEIRVFIWILFYCEFETKRKYTGLCGRSNL